MILPEMPSMSLDGKVALITGASSGIGQGAAVALAQTGAHVLCAARGEKRLRATVEQLLGKGWKAEAFILDVTDQAEVTDLFSKNKIDIVVNSAGLARHSSALETSSEDFDDVIDVNLKSAYFLSSIAAREMIIRKIKGSIIHVSSQMAYVGGIDRAVYSASKHALEGMIKSMAIEWGDKGIRINSVCPTFIRTPLTEPTFQNPERVKWIKEKIKLGRVGTVSDVMGAIFYLASDLSELVTGTSILVDGGWTAD
ncbi:MAG: 3-oxoacyl-ACP reductase [Flavobacteriaceae bacterium TMED200]|nr:MAG: 3-oxoacyl-ACP reductase [Flavobacteriaceae bacterium TMED200]|tara:strand:+ start:153 stop:914 length:762 start_codon:yes stop_codon:yes gene_type:complete